jgi:hypothetical protein
MSHPGAPVSPPNFSVSTLVLPVSLISIYLSCIPQFSFFCISLRYRCIVPLSFCIYIRFPCISHKSPCIFLRSPIRNHLVSPTDHSISRRMSHRSLYRSYPGYSLILLNLPSMREKIFPLSLREILHTYHLPLQCQFDRS